MTSIGKQYNSNIIVFFCKIFGRWRDKSVLFSESIDDSDKSASENQVVVIKEVVEDQGPKEAMSVRAVMKNRLLWKSGIWVHYCMPV